MKSRMIKIWILISILTTPLYSGAETAAAAATQPKGLWNIGHGTYYSPYALVVDKSKRKLSLWEQSPAGITRVKEFDCDQGQLDGDKQATGDKRTPEGIYFFDKKLEGPGLDFQRYGVRAFTTNYPNIFDQRNGKSGYGIWLHAVPDTVPLTRGSSGCVVVRNKDILELSQNISLQRTPILIYKKVEYVSPTAQAQSKTQIENFVRDWKDSWEKKDLDTYMNHYSESFNSLKMSKAKWRDYKNNLNQTYQNIEVRLSEPVIFEVDNNIVIRQLQHYKSDKNEDFGEKYLYIRRENGSLKIIAETWSESQKDLVLGELEKNSFAVRNLSSSSK